MQANTPFKRLPRSLWAPAALALGCAGTLLGGTALVTNSPFAPSGSALGAAAAVQEAYQLAGSTAEGADVSVCIYLQQSKRSLWIPVGGESDGVHVISYDAAHDTAVVTAGGSRRELTMRKAVIASAGQAGAARAPQIALQRDSAPAPVAAAPAPSSPEAAVKEQREARMLVSDLLEIGVQQRKAYQEAKQKAAAAQQPPQQ
jgi:hypothetical protein